MRRWCIPLVVVALSALLAEGAGACHPPPTTITILCSNARYSKAFVVDFTKDVQGDPRFVALASDCAENLGALTPVLAQEMSTWYRDDYRYTFVDGARLTFESYSSEREAALLREQRGLFNCVYPAFSQVGDWLKVWNVGREYCNTHFSPLTPLGFGEDRCFATNLRLSLVSFIGYIVAHPDRRTAPFLALLVLAVGLVGAAVVYRARRGQIRTFVKPSPVKFVFPLMVGGVACCAGGMFDTLLVIGVTYFLVAFMHPVIAAWWALGENIGG